MFIIIPLYLFTIWFSWYAIKQPENVWQPSKTRKLFWLLCIVYIILALGPIMAHDATSRSLYHIFFIWPVLCSVLFKNKIKRIFGKLFNTTWGKCLVTFIVLIPMEAFLAIDYIRTNYAQNYGVEKFINYTGIGAVFQHLFVFAGLYIGFALVIVLYGLKHQIKPKQGFLVGGLLGIIVEQQFLIPKLLFSGNIITLLSLGSWTFLIYGWYIAGPLLLFYDSTLNNTGASKKQLWIFAFLFFTVPFISWFLWTSLIGWPKT
jgi:hypothetical protein